MEAIAERLQADGQEVGTADLPGGAAVIGYRADFRLQCVATKLHLFTVCVTVPVITGPDLERFAQDALEYAVQRRGAARGFQSGVAAIPIVVAQQVDESAAAVARTKIVKRWAAFAWPAVVDTSTVRSIATRVLFSSAASTPSGCANRHQWLSASRDRSPVLGDVVPRPEDSAALSLSTSQSRAPCGAGRARDASHP